jgi:hypothetical protein
MRASGPTIILQKLREPVMGIEPMTPVLPRLCATAAPHGPTFTRCTSTPQPDWGSNMYLRRVASLVAVSGGYFRSMRCVYYIAGA